MKKTIVVLAALVLSMSMMFACGKGDGGKGGKAELKGVYTITTVESPTNGKKTADQVGMALLTLEFFDGGKVEKGFGGLKQGEGTFQLDGTKLTLTIKGEKIEGTVDGKKVTITEDGLKKTYEKQ